MLVDPQREIPQDILIESLLAFHFGNRRRRCVDIHQREMGFAVFADPVCERLKTPRLDLANGAAIVLDDGLELLGERFNLLARYVLSGQKYVFV